MIVIIKPQEGIDRNELSMKTMTFPCSFIFYLKFWLRAQTYNLPYFLLQMSVHRLQQAFYIYVCINKYCFFTFRVNSSLDFCLFNMVSIVVVTIKILNHFFVYQLKQRKNNSTRFICCLIDFVMKHLTRFKETSVNIFVHISVVQIQKTKLFFKLLFFLSSLDLIFISLPNITTTNRMIVICNPYKRGKR